GGGWRHARTALPSVSRGHRPARRRWPGGGLLDGRAGAGQCCAQGRCGTWFPSHACEVSCRVRAKKVARPLARPHPTGGAPRNLGFPTPAPQSTKRVRRSVDGRPRRQDSAYPVTVGAGCKLIKEGKEPFLDVRLSGAEQSLRALVPGG